MYISCICRYWYLIYVTFSECREAERLQLWENAKTIVSDSKTILDKVKTLYNSHAAKLPESVTKGVHLAQQKYNTSQQIVSVEDNTAEISNQQLVTVSENFRFLSNTHDFVKQSIRKSLSNLTFGDKQYISFNRIVLLKFCNLNDMRMRTHYHWFVHIEGWYFVCPITWELFTW